MSYAEYLGNDDPIPPARLREVYRELAAFLNQNVDKQRESNYKKLMDRILVQAYKGTSRDGRESIVIPSASPKLSTGLGAAGPLTPNPALAVVPGFSTLEDSDWVSAISPSTPGLSAQTQPAPFTPEFFAAMKTSPEAVNVGIPKK